MDWGYVTGYFDGEGNVYLKKRKTRSQRGASLTWFNTHLASLEAIHAFIGAGVVKAGKKPVKPEHRQVYMLVVSQCEEVVRVAEAMLPHSLVKHEQLVAAIEQAKAVVPMRNHGNLAAKGPEWVRSRYWDDGLDMAAIGDLVGVSRAAVKNYMHRQGIPARTLSEANAKANLERSPKDERERRAKLSEARRKLWQDPAYRERAVAAMRNGKPRGDNLRKAVV